MQDAPILIDSLEIPKQRKQNINTLNQKPTLKLYNIQDEKDTPSKNSIKIEQTRNPDMEDTSNPINSSEIPKQRKKI